MADAAAARREARRKRILENSQNRLQLIAGKASDEVLKDVPSNASPIPQSFENTGSAFSLDSIDSEHSFHNGVIGAQSESIQSLLSRSDVAGGDTINLANIVQPIATEPQRESLWQTIITFKYDIVLLSLLLQIIYGLSSIPSENIYFFVPLLVYNATKSLLFPKQSNSMLANVLLLLNGMSSNPNRLHKMLYIFNWFASFSQDASVFIFSTICIQSLYIAVNNYLFT